MSDTQRKEQLSDAENQERALEEELEHLEEETDRQGFFARLKSILKKIFASPKESRPQTRK
ncbi:MAG TPA: hypothetical protein VMR52_03500 [Dehalococcoidia bacterium]|nr:hypothetical protein [Dehalococcoidia bacterium]